MEFCYFLSCRSHILHLFPFITDDSNLLGNISNQAVDKIEAALPFTLGRKKKKNETNNAEAIILPQETETR